MDHGSNVTGGQNLVSIDQHNPILFNHIHHGVVDVTCLKSAPVWSPYNRYPCRILRGKLIHKFLICIQFAVITDEEAYSCIILIQARLATNGIEIIAGGVKNGDRNDWIDGLCSMQAGAHERGCYLKREVM